MRHHTLISASELAESLGDPHLVVIDCRFDLADPAAGRAAYEQAHIPGAGFADLNQDLSSPATAESGRHPLPDPHAVAAHFAALGVREGVQVVVYDAMNGSFASRAWWLLRWLRLSAVAVLDGGFAAWLATGGRVEAGAGAAVSGTWQPSADRAAWLSTAQVEAALRDPARLLVDARAADRFAGKVEPLDTVAGHVKGAVNFPFSDNLGSDGRFLPVPELRERWRARLGRQRPEDVAMMCGSGVTACHNLLALEHAGFSGGKLYAGSWSEWIKNPSRPIERGSENDLHDE